MKAIFRETCDICKKIIYTHNFVAVCCLNGKIYHGKCLNFSNDVTLDIQTQHDWFCPLCLADIFPFFNLPSNHTVEPCTSCSKLISCNRDKVSRCVTCSGVCHSDCLLLNNNCLQCYDIIINQRDDDCDYLNNFNHYNPYVCDDEDNNYYFDDDIDNFCDTLATSSLLLERCKVMTQSTFNSNFDSFTNYISIFYHNIDGFKSNFNEFLNQNLNFSRGFDFYCFVETNLKENVPNDYDLGDSYTHERFFAIDDKHKGSGISIYYKKHINFTRINKLCIRNQYFECMGGYIDTDVLRYYVVVLYRFNKSSNNKTSNNNTSSVEELFDKLSNILDSISDKPCIILGDFNFNLFNFNTDKTVARYSETFFTRGFAPLIGKPTHIRKSTITLIDQIWCNFVAEPLLSAALMGF